MKGCELCGVPARMYCESDQASLCWDCDEKVHAANFLVAKHCRSLLCQACQAQTPWKASGLKLGPTVSICHSCSSAVHGGGMAEEPSEGGEDSEEGDDETDEDETDDDEEEEEEDDDDDDEEEGENQVVPWSATRSVAAVPPASSSESSEERISSRVLGSKRMREHESDLDSDDEVDCSSSHLGSGRSTNEEGNSLGSIRPWKQRRPSHEVEDHDNGQSESRSTAIIDSLRGFQRDHIVTNGENASATILAICKLSRDRSR